MMKSRAYLKKGLIIKYLILFSLLYFTSVGADNIQSNSIKTLTLSIPKTHFIKKRRPYYKSYIREKALTTVIATYSDGHSEEVTDNVKWSGAGYGRGKVIKVLSSGRLWTWVGNATLKASIGNIVSNTLNIDVSYEKEGRLLDVKIESQSNRGYLTRDARVSISLMDIPTSGVLVRLRLKESDGVRFRDEYTLTKEILYATQKYEYGKTVDIVDVDNNNTQPYTIITEVLESNDARYEGKDPEDIVVVFKKEIKLEIPPLQQRRGAIRGVAIQFNILSEQYGLKYTLIDAPRGMKVVGVTDASPYEHDRGLREGVTVKWDVPLDIEEKIYNITVKATDKTGKSKEITFPIKVPKTKSIPTKLVNNELIVTDKSSPLYGMKMKGHSEEDISKMRLKSVAYRDVWKLTLQNLQPDDIVERTIFILDNISNNIDIKFFEDIDTNEKRLKLGAGLFEYVGGSSINTGFWKQRHRNNYEYEGTNGLTISGIGVYMLIIRKSQIRGK